MPIVEGRKGKPIQLYPPFDLRKQLEAEAKQQSRSLNNLILVILMKFFRAKSNEAEHVG